MTVEDIIEMHNVSNTLTDSARFNSRIWCHYISWALKICLDDLNEVKKWFYLDGIFRSGMP